MFAEEHGSNAARRRQEENRARRRKLKQQQEQKKKAEARLQLQKAATAGATTMGPSSPGSALPVATELVVPPVPISAASSTDVIEIPAPPSGPKNAAVANALQQRQQRQEVQQKLKAAMTIQTFYRAHRSNSRLIEQQSGLLKQRLTDLATLTNLLRQKANKMDYVPPPATTTALCQQMLFLTQTIPYLSARPEKNISRVLVNLRSKSQDAKNLHQLLNLVILPGVYSSDENVNPFLVWLQSKAGRMRLERLLRLVLLIATTSGVDEATHASCCEFIRALTGATEKMIPESIAEFGRSRLLLTASPQKTNFTGSEGRRKQDKPIAKHDTSLDLIGLLRFHLMYNTGGPDPIPKAADHSREASIPAKDRIQSDAFLQTVLHIIQKQGNAVATKHYYLRFLSEILTVPLLTWKTRDTSTKQLLAFTTINGSRKIFLVGLLENFCSHYGDVLSAGDLGLTLCNDTSLVSCPATPTQCLLANLLQLGRLSPLLNGNHVSKFHFAGATIYYQFLATLIDSVPLVTLMTRESVVEWTTDGKGHHAPVVLSTVILEHCRYILVDSFVRKLFHCAIDDEVLKTEEILQSKTDKDLKHEKDLQEAGATSAASMAAKEARVDRTKGFWKSSAWARKLSKGVSNILTTDKRNSKGGKSKTIGSKLINATTMSRKLASGAVSLSTDIADDCRTSDIGTEGRSTAKESVRIGYTSDLLLALCRVYGTILARWGGGGGDDIVNRKASLLRSETMGARQEIATKTADMCTKTLLNNLIFSTGIIKASWALIQSDPTLVTGVYSLIDPRKGKAPVRSHNIKPCYDSKTSKHHNQTSNGGAALLFVFVCSLSHILIVTDDSEIHEMEKPIPLHQLRRCIQTLKQLLYRACCLDDVDTSDEDEASSLRTSATVYASDYFGLSLINASARTMRDLYDRSSRRPLSIPKLWLIDDLLEKEIRRCKTADDYVNLLSTPVLRVCPFLVSFKRRLKLFERIVATNHIAIQGENSQNPFHTNPLKPGIPVRITRGRILEDGLATMNNLGRNMRQRLAVQYFNEAGTQETGIDAGGLFKEFWTDLCAIAFDPNYALFRVTEENCMYPNPSSRAAHGSDHTTLFGFLGRILGKALFEGITVHPQFAHFFLSHLRGDYNYLHMLADLSTMDSQLYNNIMFLKTYDGDAEDLCLTFTVANDDFGNNREIPLMPNGANIEVTNSNKQRYIGLVAKYYVVDRIKEQAEAFTKGLHEVIDTAWIKIFNEPELQVLISGASEGKLDVDDLRSHSRYAGGFTGIDRTVSRFWSVVASFDSKQQADLLRFVTSCERPPPLGFASLNPPFTIQRVGIMRDGDKLPTSSTCFNVLKLPTYSSEKVMKERLLYAIQAGAGFELS